MAIGTPEYSIKALNEKTNAEIEQDLKKSKEELFNLRFQAATSQLTNSSRVGAVKHDIARMYTVLRERELGITKEPAPTDTKKKTAKKSSPRKSSAAASSPSAAKKAAPAKSDSKSEE